MVDYKNSSPDWQRHAGDILILPIGTTEQHGGHLPLNTLTVNCTRIAQAVAEHFDAALLPTIPISNSIVNTGFRGSFSFAPETLMKMIRDLAAEAERQHFRFLILISGENNMGLLDAVACDINRNDRDIKLLTVYPPRFADNDILTANRRNVNDFFAGEKDTSRYLDAGGMLLAQPEPDQTRDYAPKIPWLPTDLATFGIGNMNPPGYVGLPAEASGTKGRLLNTCIIESVVTYLEDRLSRLRHSSRYAGPGGLATRPLTRLDMPELMHLVEQANQNQQVQDWEFLLDTNPQGSIGMVFQGKVIGTAMVLNYPDGPAWINMVLVDREFQDYSVPDTLINEILKQHKDREFRLDAPSEKTGMFRELGFQLEFEIMRLVRSGGPLPPEPQGILRVAATDLGNMTEMDAANFISRREFVLERLFREDHDCSFMLERGDGFLLSRKGRRYRHLGPVYAPDDRMAADLVAAAIRSCNGGELVIDVPKFHTDFIEYLRKMGFIVQKKFFRMGKNTVRQEKKNYYFATIGPEFG